MKTLDRSTLALALALDAAFFVGCTRDPVIADGGGSSDTTDPTVVTTTTTATTETSPSVDDTTEDEPQTTVPPDPSDSETSDVPECETDDGCNLVDLVFIIDNSGSMGDEQLRLARSFEALVEQLEDLSDVEGNALNVNVNVMVTTTDIGHPLCTAFKPPDYTPAVGSPISTGCNSRINHFTGLDPMNPVLIQDACTENCPVDIAPDDAFINMRPNGSNVPDDDVAGALACVAPQGVVGCGFESPLEAMLQALNESACWNDPQQSQCQEQPEWMGVTDGFLRDGSVVAVVLMTDELDCSIQIPEGYSFFTDPSNDVFWNTNPDTGTAQATSAVCFNAGVTCTDDNDDGIYDDCTASDSEALQPLARYTAYLDYLSQSHEVVMLNLSGVPEVLETSPIPPFEPTAGGVVDLVYRDWLDFPYPAGDILPDEWSEGVQAAHKKFLFGDLGPGCFAQDDGGQFVSQALPPVRTREVCESLNSFDEETGDEIVRCCIESVCDSDFSDAFRCLGGLLTVAFPTEP